MVHNIDMNFLRKTVTQELSTELVNTSLIFTWIEIVDTQCFEHVYCAQLHHKFLQAISQKTISEILTKAYIIGFLVLITKKNTFQNTQPQKNQCTLYYFQTSIHYNVCNQESIWMKTNCNLKNIIYLLCLLHLLYTSFITILKQVVQWQIINYHGNTQYHPTALHHYQFIAAASQVGGVFPANHQRSEQMQQTTFPQQNLTDNFFGGQCWVELLSTLVLHHVY
eukprot:TRINITY_DN3410_c1_g1_i2.p2 TRINITY_DN3410_c1_g1~~TRINITY_DN3410_c1_g1_i2.p2  ORF type:complete len:223 (+),score=-12.10 TRINITY_DN3410_c1_g1_i2:760-1428(+)